MFSFSDFVLQQNLCKTETLENGHFHTTECKHIGLDMLISGSFKALNFVLFSTKAQAVCPVSVRHSGKLCPKCPTFTWCTARVPLQRGDENLCVPTIYSKCQQTAWLHTGWFTLSKFLSFKGFVRIV